MNFFNCGGERKCWTRIITITGRGQERPPELLHLRRPPPQDCGGCRLAQTINTLAQTAATPVKQNGLFVLPGIGRLVRGDRKARIGCNIAAGEAIKIAAKSVVKFRVAKAAKEAIVPPKAKFEA